ncbi:hypothetical protein DY123_06205 [Apilactobacillus micheneri]|uniref:DUF5776 domain-containing protein n=1 Tax=Apilactobacillus micheneri TaxID=1899430 RepID=UPI0011298C1A|nr:DUF5776 domain-containing protein [Apilactobacillus micheneri]TPR41464.1 hypothetical protein DY123_06205 [Apilactobacillus micheneri]
MQYNKQQFNKVNDKKIMKKVKKQWVVVSVASLAVLGGFAVSGTLNMTQPSSAIVAHASEGAGGQTPSDQSKSGGDSGKGESNSTPSTTNDAAKNVNSDYQSGKQATSEDNQSQQYNNNSKGFNDTLNNNKAGQEDSDNGDYKAGQSLATQYQDAIRDGASDFINHKGDNSKSQTSDNEKYYKSSYDGAQKASQLYKDDTSDAGTSTKDYTSYNNSASSSNDGSHSSGENPSTGNTINKDNASGTAGAVDSGSASSNNYNDKNGVPTNNDDSYNPNTGKGGADNPSSASTSESTYENYLDKKFNNQNNSSVQLPESGNLKVPSSEDSDITNSKSVNGIQYNGVYSDSFRYGANAFLSYQGAIDAKTGKWQGTNYDKTYIKDKKTSSTTDFYDNNEGYKSNNLDSYYQSYEGAKQAIKDQFKDSSGNDTSGINSSNSISQYNNALSNNTSNNSYFSSGYDNVSQDVKNGIGYVNNSAELQYVMTTSSAIGKLNTLRLSNDLNYNDIGTSTSETNNSVTSDSFNLDGQNHIADFKGTQYGILFNNPSDVNNTSNNFNISNFKTLYGTNYYGPFKGTNGGNLTFKNFNYVGPQMLDAPNDNVYIGGNVNVHQNMNSAGGSGNVYNSPFNYNISGDMGAQQNLNITNLTVLPGSNYFGDDDSYRGGNLIQLKGNLTIGENSNVTLVPRGYSAGDGTSSSSNGNSNYGIYFTGGSGSKLNLSNNANLNIIPAQLSSDNNGGYSQGYASAIYDNGGQINIDGGNINIEANGSTYGGNNPLYLTSGAKVNITNNGLLQIKSNNNSSGNGSNGLLYNSGSTINVSDGGNLIVDTSDSSNTDNNISLINGAVNVNNPGKIGVVLKTNSTKGNILNGASSSLNANTVQVNNKLYYSYKLNGSSGNNLTTVDQKGSSSSSQFSGNDLIVNQVPGAYFVGPVNVHYNSQTGKVTISGNAQVSGGTLSGDNHFYIKYSDSNLTDINSPQSYSNQVDNYNDKTLFNDEKQFSNDSIVPFSFEYKSDNAPTDVTVLLKYGINGVQLTKQNQPDYNQYKYNSINYNGQGSSGVNSEKSLVTLRDGNTNDITNGATDAANIESSGNTVSPDETTLSNNPDYRNGYNAGKAGYEAFNNDINGTKDPANLDYTDDSSYKNNYKGKGYDNQFATGFNQAKNDYSHGVTDGKKSAQSGSPVNSGNAYIMSNGQTKVDGTKNQNYQAGFNNFNEGYKLAITNPSNGSVPANQQAGFNYGKSVVDGAQSDVKPSEDNPDKLAGYNAAQQAKDDLYKNGSSDNINSPSDVKLPDTKSNPFDASAYQSAYYGAYEANKYSEDKNPDKTKPSGLDAIAQNSFDKQLGSNDFLSGNGDSSVKQDGSGKPSDAYSAGYLSTQSGFNATPGADGKIAPNGNAEFDQGAEAKNGYTDAKNGKAPTKANGNSQVEINSYWGAKAGENSPDQPGGDQNVDKNSAAYKSGQSQSQQDTAKGAQDYINDKSQGKTDLTPSGNDSLYNQGYNNQKAYDAGFNGKTDGVDTTSKSYQDGKSAAASNSDFNKVKDGKSNSTIDGNYENNGALQGFNDAKSGSQFNPSNGMKDKDGNTLTGDDATKYQGAYAKAYSEANDQMNKGAQQYSSDKNNGISTDAKPTDSSAGNQDAQSFNQGYDNQKAYDDGFNNPSASMPANYQSNDGQKKAYLAGQNAAKSLPTNSGNNSPMNGAATDANNSDPTKTDNRPKDDSSSQQASENAKKSQDAYDGAKAGYVDGSSGSPANSNVGKSSDYQQAYNKAYGDMQKSRQDGTNDFFDPTKGNSLNNPSDINGKHSSDNNNSIGDKAHNNAFAEQQGYAAGLATNPATYNDNNNPYNNDPDKGNADSNFNAYKNGFNNASTASAGYKAAQSKSNPSVSDNPITGSDGQTISDPTSQEAYKAAAQAFADAKANKPSDNSGKDANYKNAYNMAYNQNRAAMSEGENDALGKDGGNTNIPSGQYPSDITTPSAKALYDNAKGNASQGYADAMKPSNANNANAPEGSSKEYTDGYKQAKSISAGANAAIAGAKQAPTASGNQNQDQVNAGFNAAQQAIKNGLADAQSGKNQTNGKLDQSKIVIPSGIPSSASQAYKDAYTGAYNGYNNGLNGGSQKPSSDKDAKYGNDTTYSAAYDNAFKQGQNDIPAPTPTPAPNNNNKPNNDKDDQAAGIKAGQKAFAGGTPLNINHVNFAGKSQAYKDAFTKGYNDSQAGFDAGINGGKNNNSDNPSFKAGYQSAQAYKQGVKDATRGKKPAKNSSDAYKVGYEAYKEGISGKKANKATLDKLAPAYRKAYEKNYQAAHKEYVAVAGKAAKAGRKNAVGNNRIPRSLKRESPAYQAAYMKAFNDYVKRNLPSYVYNLKKVYSHDAPALTRSTRVKKYSKTPRYDRHVFRVLGYKITSSGHVVYRVKGLGWISASDKSVDNVYYRRHDTKKPIQKVRVIKPQGTYIYNSKSFNKKTAVKKMKKGSTVNVKSIETVGGITRFYIGNGQYISSNKTIVEHVR